MNPFFSPENMEKLLENLHEGIQMVDRRGTVVLCNEAAAKLDNLKKEEVVGRHILDIYPSLTEKTSTIIRVLQTGKAIHDYQQTFLNYKGSKITTINTTIPLFLEENVTGALEISSDITRVRELSEKLVDLQKKMYQSKGRESPPGKNRARYTFDHIIGRSPVLMKLKEQAVKAAMTHSAVMVYGNTGTGKELFVQAIHHASPRANHPFVAQNCAAIPSTLLESILFGTVKGSFTGSDDRPGLFELAHDGTLLLDEINSMPMELQAKLLRVLEEGLIRRVGDIRTREVNVRIIAALNENPFTAVQNKSLREDLFYRLNVVSLQVPDLKDRWEDFALLTNHFIEKFNERLGKEVTGLSPRAMGIMKNHVWPGNIRELENVIEGTMNVMDGRLIKPAHLPEYLRKRKDDDETKPGNETVPVNGTLKQRLELVERKIIEKTYRKCGKNVTQTANQLGIPRQTLQYRLQKLEVK